MEQYRRSRIDELVKRVKELEPDFDMMVVGDDPIHWVKLTSHPRLLDALEAALVVLADHPSTWKTLGEVKP